LYLTLLNGVQTKKNRALEKVAKTSANEIFDVPEQNRNNYLVFLARQFIGTSSDIGLVLDLGCNYGSFLIDFEQIEAIGMDLRHEPLSVFNKHSKGKYGLVQASGTNLPFSESLFDVIFLWDVIEHVPPKSELTVLREVNRLLAKGGMLLMSTPSNNLVSIITDPAFFLRRHRHYSRKDIREMLRLSNFEVLSISLKGNLSTILAINMLYFRKWVLRSKMLDELQKKLNERHEQAVRSRNEGNLEWYVAATKKE